MKKYSIPKGIEKEAAEYIQGVLAELENRGVLENIDNAALDMLARNYSTFIKASKQLEIDGLTVTSDRGKIAPHPLAKDAQTQAMKVMLEFGLTAKARTKLPKMDKTDDEESTPLEQFIVTGKKEVR